MTALPTLRKAVLTARNSVGIDPLGHDRAESGYAGGAFLFRRRASCMTQLRPPCAVGAFGGAYAGGRENALNGHGTATWSVPARLGPAGVMALLWVGSPRSPRGAPGRRRVRRRLRERAERTRIGCLEGSSKDRAGWVHGTALGRVSPIAAGQGRDLPWHWSGSGLPPARDRSGARPRLAIIVEAIHVPLDPDAFVESIAPKSPGGTR